MPPQSRGTPPQGLQSKSTPNLPTLRSFSSEASIEKILSSNHHSHGPDIVTSPSEDASLEDFSLDSRPSLSVPSDDESASQDEDDDDDNRQGETTNRLSNRPLSHHAFSRSHTYLGPSAFAPPFYNRPPTPLPPSPSLTSLLRPTFSSAAPSRPNTPDPSSDEGTPTTNNNTGTQTPNSTSALLKSAKASKPIPRASPKVPTYEYYGFTLYLTSSLSFLLYLLWSFLPSALLHQLGIYYYPDRWWALAIPAWTVMGVFYMYVALAGYNTEVLTLGLEKMEVVVDEAACVAVIDSQGRLVKSGKPSWATGGKEEKSRHHTKGRKGAGGGAHSRQGSAGRGWQLDPDVDWRSLWNEGTDAVMDIPVGGVCEILYGSYDDDDDDDDDDIGTNEQ